MPSMVRAGDGPLGFAAAGADWVGCAGAAAGGSGAKTAGRPSMVLAGLGFGAFTGTGAGAGAGAGGADWASISLGKPSMVR
ncbi:MAG: hypothetical protein KBB95_26530 [Deltaproteobacteria bacterium]|nr:hypothetical protein [Deltaproteobacteria bacterium]